MPELALPEAISTAYVSNMRAVLYTRTAAKTLGKMGQAEAARVRGKIAQLASDPASVAGSIAALKGVDAERLRVGDWRVIFQMEPARLVILKIGHRREVYD